MSLLRHIASGMRALLCKKKADAELDEEVRLYLEMGTADKIKQQKTPQEVARAVRFEQGAIDSTKEIVGAASWEYRIAESRFVAAISQEIVEKRRCRYGDRFAAELALCSVRSS